MNEWINAIWALTIIHVSEKSKDQRESGSPKVMLFSLSQLWILIRLSNHKLYALGLTQSTPIVFLF
jgi:hypothetical protein